MTGIHKVRSHLPRYHPGRNWHLLAAAFRINIDIRIAKMPAEGAVGCFKKVWSFYRHCHPGWWKQPTILCTKPVWAAGIGRLFKTRQGCSVRKEMQRRTIDSFIICNVGDLYLHPWLFVLLVVGVLEHHGIMINKVVFIAAGRNGKCIRHAFGLSTATCIAQLNGITSVRTVHQEAAIGLLPARECRYDIMPAANWSRRCKRLIWFTPPALITLPV